MRANGRGGAQIGNRRAKGRAAPRVPNLRHVSGDIGSEEKSKRHQQKSRCVSGPDFFFVTTHLITGIPFSQTKPQPLGQTAIRALPQRASDKAASHRHFPRETRVRAPGKSKANGRARLHWPPQDHRASSTASTVALPSIHSAAALFNVAYTPRSPLSSSAVAALTLRPCSPPDFSSPSLQADRKSVV